MNIRTVVERLDVIERLSWIHIRDNRVLFVRSPEGDVFFDPGVKRQHEKPDALVLADKMRLDLDIELIPDSIRRMTSFSFAAPAYGKEDGCTVEIYCYESDFLGHIQPTKQIKEVEWFTSRDKDRTSDAGKAILQRLESEGLID